jgi:hypothetical protein
MFRVWDPIQTLARNISITPLVTTGLGGAFIVNGWDIHNQAMSESITVAASTTTSYYGKKAFKYIASITPSAAAAANKA